jgi:hypothetical protein
MDDCHFSYITKLKKEKKKKRKSPVPGTIRVDRLVSQYLKTQMRLNHHTLFLCF